MERWNAIDLHMHTCVGITRDKKNDIVNFSYQKFVKVLIDYDLQLCAVTNHNVINFENYIMINYLSKLLNRTILLGIEIDTITDTQLPLHIVAIFSKDFKNNYDVCIHINKLISKKNSELEIVYNSDEIIELLQKYDTILIPHGIKSKGIFKNATEENIMEALKKVKEGFIKVFDSPSNWKLEQIKDFLSSIGEDNLDEFGGVLFSDIRDWDKYEEKFRHFYMNAEPTFKGLIHSITNPTRRLKQNDSININRNYISKIVFSAKDTNNQVLETTINFSNDYNCIIGKSGSGKSLLLNLIKRELTNDNKVDVEYSFAKHTILKIYNENGILLNPDLINVGIGASLYDKIISANATKSNDDTYSIIELISKNFIKREKFNIFLTNYKNNIIKYYKLLKKIKDNNKSITEKMNILNGKIIQKDFLNDIKTFDITIYEDCKITYDNEFINDFSQYNNYITPLRNILFNCKESEKEDILETIKKLETQFNQLSFKINYRNLKEKLKFKKIKIIKDAVEGINGGISKKAELKAKLKNEIPIDIAEIVKLIRENFLNKLESDIINLNINPYDIDDEKIVNKKYKILVKEKLNFDLTNFNIRENPIFNTYGKKTSLENKTIDFTNLKDAKDLINQYIELNLIDENKTGISENFDVSVQILFDKQDVNELNPGTIAKTYISIYFEEEIKNGENSVILFDQIENDVDKPFISDVLKDLIEDTKGHVQLIIVTHDPIVAVNADPTNYIEASRIDNIFSYRNFCPESSLKDELDTIAKNVDGSKDVIKNRYEIYGGESIL